jgi:hypothetical protein
MTFIRTLRSTLRTLAVAALVSLALIRPAAAFIDWTDIWWATPENGWGVNFVQSDQFIFATFFVYGPNLQPDWYTGQMTYNASTGVWSGGLYRSTGSYFGAPYNKNDSTIAPVGSVTFKPTNSWSGTLTYNVNNVNVNKQIQRLTLTTIPIGGNYYGGIYEELTSCANSSQNGVIRRYSEFAVAQTTQETTSQIKIDFAVENGVCTLSGRYYLDGSLYSMPNASYKCTTGIDTTAVVTGVKATQQGIEGQWAAQFNNGCIDRGYFSAVLN